MLLLRRFREILEEFYNIFLFFINSRSLVMMFTMGWCFAHHIHIQYNDYRYFLPHVSTRTHFKEYLIHIIPCLLTISYFIILRTPYLCMLQIHKRMYIKIFFYINKQYRFLSFAGNVEQTRTTLCIKHHLVGQSTHRLN